MRFLIDENLAKSCAAVLPIARYRRLLQLLEDYGLGQAILEAEKEPRHSKMEALDFLEKN